MEWELAIDGMTCSLCEGSVKACLYPLDGVEGVVVRLEEGRALVQTNENDSQTNAELGVLLPRMLEGIGYEAKCIGLKGLSLEESKTLWREVTLRVTDMTCQVCEGVVSSTLEALKGVVSATADFSRKVASAVVRDGTLELEALVGALADSYPAEILQVKLVRAADAGEAPKSKEAAQQAEDRKAASTTKGLTGPGAAEKQVEATTIVFPISGMTCAACVHAIERGLGKAPGVSKVSVGLALEQAEVTFDAAILGKGEVLALVSKLGYTPGEVRAEREDGEEDWEEDGACSGASKADKERAQMLRRVKWRFLKSLVFTAPLLVIAMVLMHLVPMQSPAARWLHTTVAPGLSLNTLLQWVLATPVQFGSGAMFYRGAGHEITNRALGMNFLVAAGTSAAYLYSMIQALLGLSRRDSSAGDSLFFETSAVLISFVLLGKWLEAKARGSASNAVAKLLALKAEEAILVPLWPEDETGGGEEAAERVVASASLRPGDVVRVVRGSKIPGDGVVVQGSLAADESMITGESMPIAKDVGDAVIGATLSIEGLAYVRLTRTGKNTTLHQIVRLVERAQLDKAPIQEFGDRVASVFVPVVLFLSLSTFVIWMSLTSMGVVPAHWHDDQSSFLFSFLFGLAVLVIACPCAVGLAAPTAIMVGCGVGASQGLLIKGGSAIQSAASITSVIFDKTGTLTEGKPRVTKAFIVQSTHLPKELGADSGRAILRLVASAEKASEHPLAAAVWEYAAALNIGGGEKNGEGLLPIADGTFRATSGRGLEATVAGVRVVVGSPTFVSTFLLGSPNAPLPVAVQTLVEEMEEAGQTVVLALLDGALAAIFGCTDKLRPEASRVVLQLHRLGVEVWMVTGDNRRAAQEVAARAGIRPDHVLAHVLPSEKADEVAKLQQAVVRGRKAVVAMVGDGINDAPALVQADVGISVGSGTAVAIESSDVVLMRANLKDVLTVLHLSRRIYRRIKLNYLWALGYNSLGIPVAAGVLFPAFRYTLPPMLAGAAMAISSVSVCVSSLLLKLYKPPLLASEHCHTVAPSGPAAVAPLETLGRDCFCAPCPTLEGKGGDKALDSDVSQEPLEVVGRDRESEIAVRRRAAPSSTTTRCCSSCTCRGQCQCRRT